jgi:hypothetical protein
MFLNEMIDCIEASGKESIWILCEAEMNAVSRFKLRDTFFKALKELGEPLEIPTMNWEE